MPDIKSPPLNSFAEFLEAIRRHKSIRTVRVMDYGFTEPTQRNGAWVIQPRVRLVLTALDRATGTLLRCEEKTDATGTVTIDAFSGVGRHREAGVTARRRELSTILEEEGYLVEPGEWTLESAKAFLESYSRNTTPQPKPQAG